MTTVPAVDHDFYINDLNDDFYLHEAGEWRKLGKLVRAHVIGLWSESTFPFVSLQSFELALSKTDEHFYPDFSASQSTVSCIFPTAASCDVILTDSLSGFLGTGSNAICTAHFEGVAQEATLTFNDVIVRAHTPLWIVLPATPDVAMAGLRCLFASEPL